MKVFISHAHIDESLVKKVTAALEGAGLEVWDDTREIMPGDNWAGKVAQALQESEAMVVLLTPDALRSSWVRRDIEYALGYQNYRKRLIPVLVGDLQELSKEDVPWILRHLRMIKLAEHTKEDSNNSPPPLIVTTMPFGCMSPQSTWICIACMSMDFLHSSFSPAPPDAKDIF